MPNTDLNLSDSSIKCHPIPLTVDEVAVIHRLVQTHLVMKPEDDPEYSTYENWRLSTANVRLATALNHLLDIGYTLHDEVEQLSSG